MECPICMEEINDNNKTMTECGHLFHSACLMKNVAHNGFNCPYCRTSMAEVPDVDSAESEDDSFESVNSEDDNSVIEVSSDYVMRGMRFIFQRAEGESYTEEDEENETSDEEILLEPKFVHSTASIMGTLVSKGITMEDLLECILSDYRIYNNNEEYEIKQNRLTGLIIKILSSPEELPAGGVPLSAATVTAL